MPKRKKASELTDEEALKRLFPKPVREELKKTAHKKDENGPNPEPSKSLNTK